MSEAARGLGVALAPGEGSPVARNAFYLFLGQVATTALSVVLAAALGRSLGAEDYGLLYLITSMSVFAYAFVDWGRSSYILLEVSRRPGRAGALMGTFVAIGVVGAAAVGGLSMLVTWLLGYDLRTRELAALLIVAGLPFYLAQTYGLVFRAHERMDREAATGVANKVLTLAITLPALALGGRLLAVILAQGAAGLGALALGVLWYRRLRLPPLQATRDAARELVLEGTPFAAMQVAIWAQGSVDAVILSKFAAPAAVGWYGAARNVMNAAITPAALLGAASFPRLARAATDTEEFKREVRSGIRPLLGLGVLGSVGIYLFSDAAVHIIYTRKEFGPAAVILQVFAIGLLFLFLDVFFGYAAVALGRQKQVSIAKFFVVLLTAGLDLLLVPFCQARFGNGGLGLVLAFGCGELVMVAIAMSLMPRSTLDRGLLLDLGRAVCAGAGTLLLARAIPPVSPALGIPACVLTFLALSVAVGLVRRADIALLTAVLSRRAGGTGQ